MGVTYDLKFRQLIKNAVIFSFALLPMNIFFLFLGAIPFLLFLFGGIGTMIGVILCALLGFSWFLLIWTDYSQWAFDKFINDRVPGAQKNRGIYEKVSKDDARPSKSTAEQLAQSSRTVLTRRPIKPITDDEAAACGTSAVLQPRGSAAPAGKQGGAVPRQRGIYSGA